MYIEICFSYSETPFATMEADSYLFMKHTAFHAPRQQKYNKEVTSLLSIAVSLSNPLSFYSRVLLS